jgi:hypothetical protein
MERMKKQNDTSRGNCYLICSDWGKIHDIILESRVSENIYIYILIPVTN